MSLDWFAPGLLPVLWVVLSTGGMYLAVVILARASGVRSFAELSTFDIAVTIAIGSLLATTVASENPPLLQGLTAIATLYAIQLGVSRLRSRRRVVAKALNNPPILLMDANGELRRENMRIARVTEDDLRTHLRQANVIDPANVQAVVMEGTGAISVLHGHDRKLAGNDWILENVRCDPNGP